MKELISVLKSHRLGVQFILKMIPLDLWDWKPHPSMRTTSVLANHLACSLLVLLEALKGNINDKETIIAIEQNNMTLDAQGLTKIYDEGFSKLMGYLNEHLEDAHEKNIRLFYRDNESSIYVEVYDEIGHQLFHLGQLFTYLKQNDIPVDMGAYYGYKDPDPSIPPNK